MIVLDTNVLSELMRSDATPRVLAWMNRQGFTNLFTTAVVQAEVLHGIALLPRGKRRHRLELAAAGLFGDFQGRVLPFDSDAAHDFAEIVAGRAQRGRPVSTADAQIGAIVKSRGARLATRNGSDFEFFGVEIVDPWAE